MAQRKSRLSPNELASRQLKVGDTLVAQGKGMCYRSPNLNKENQAQFVPLDCSGIYWNDVSLQTEPQSGLLNTQYHCLIPSKANCIQIKTRQELTQDYSGYYEIRMNIIF